MRLTAVFETWHIGDGNYPPLHKGQLVNLSFELESQSLSKGSISQNSLTQIHDAEYEFSGVVVKIYSDPPNGKIVVIEAGDFRFFVYSSKRDEFSFKEGDAIAGRGKLLLDHYIWVEFLSRYRDHPDLFYRLRVTRIRSVTIPESFISRTEKGIAGPTSLGREQYATAATQDIENMEDAEGDWLFYLVDFDSSDVGPVDVPRTFRS